MNWSKKLPLKIVIVGTDKNTLAIDITIYTLYLPFMIVVNNITRTYALVYFIRAVGKGIVAKKNNAISYLGTFRK